MFLDWYWLYSKINHNGKRIWSDMNRFCSQVPFKHPIWKFPKSQNFHGSHYSSMLFDSAQSMMPLSNYSWASNVSQQTDEGREKLLPIDLMPTICIMLTVVIFTMVTHDLCLKITSKGTDLILCCHDESDYLDNVFKGIILIFTSNSWGHYLFWHPENLSK